MTKCKCNVRWYLYNGDKKYRGDIMKKGFLKTIGLILCLAMIFLIQGCGNNKKISDEDVLWKFKVGNISSSPVIFDNSIIFGSDDKSIYSIDLETHEKKWSFESDEIINSNPIIDNKNVIFVTQSNCYALDATTGKEIWKYESNNSGKEKIDVYDFHSASPIIYKDLIIFINRGGSIYGINKSNGNKEWEYKADGCGDIMANPGIQDNILCFADVNGNCYAMDLDNQKTLWSTNIGSEKVHVSFAYKDYAYFAGRNKNVVAFDLKTGSKKWSYEDPQGSWMTGDILAKDDIIYIGGSDNHKMLSFKYDTGSEEAVYKTNLNIFSKPVIVDDTLYCTDGDVYTFKSGYLYGFDLNSGEKKIELSFPKGIYTTPVVKDNVIYVACSDGNLYAVKK